MTLGVSTPSHFVLVNQSCFGTDRDPRGQCDLTHAWVDDVAPNFCVNLNTHAKYTLGKGNLP